MKYPRYPEAEFVQWGYGPLPTYYRGLNTPVAAVQHTMAGFFGTALAWARAGHFGASWHFSIRRSDGHVVQHLDLEDGGYHAGIPKFRANRRLTPAPTWPLWRGYDVNVNTYTVGIEHEDEAMAGRPFSAPQAAASKRLNLWLADTLGYPYDRDHMPPHADIDLTNRPNDFNTRALRDEHYAYLLEDDMTPEQLERLDRLEELVLKVGTVVAGWSTGADFTTVAGAMEKFGPLAADDTVSLHRNLLELAANAAAIGHTHDDLELPIGALLRVVATRGGPAT